jgi:lipopolysaccharide/colanic/teichoic acid biosynthesis glycosyltransferase
MRYQNDSTFWGRPTEPTDAALPVWKRSVDIACCLVALPALGLATLFAAIMVRIYSPGPVFFRQERIGYRGHPFMIYKFRTMHTGASTTSHQSHFTQLMRSNTPMQKLDAKGDARLIPGGWLLRALGLDELPQVINVLRGEMSIVGPRPCIAYEFEHYTDHQRMRLNSVPGLTGLWQVSGKNRTTFVEMINFDIHYGETKSLGLDLWIISRTIPALVTQMLDTRRNRRKAAATATGGAEPTIVKTSTMPVRLEFSEQRARG